jgi:HAD superfamily hydrolase (TIGR01509 family)
LIRDGSDLVVFGCDGVLVDSEAILARVSETILAGAGIEMHAEEIAARFAGLPFRELLLAAERESGRPVTASMIERADRLAGERLRSVRATDGALRAAAALPRRAIASNASRQRLATMLKAAGLEELFSGRAWSVEDTEGGRPKPSPDVFLHAAERMRADPERCFVIEDTAHGIRAAVAAGMRPIGYTGGSHSFPGHADVLTEAGAETVIRGWNSLEPVLAALAGWREA